MSEPTNERTILGIPARGGEAKEAVIMGMGLPDTRNGFKCHYYWRPAIQDGEWTHPTKGFKVNVNSKQRKAWEQNFQTMTAAGDEPPIVKDHKEADAAATLGYVKGIRQNGAWLEELHQYLGDDARDIALRNKISIGIDPKYKNSRGQTLGSTIVHSAVTSRPLVPGQGDAIRYTASNGETWNIYTLSQANASPEVTRDQSDDDIQTLAAPQKGGGDMPLSQEQFTKLQKLPGADNVTADNGIDWLLSYAETAEEKATKLLSRATTAEEKATKAEAKILTLSSTRTDDDSTPEPDPEILRDRADNYRGKIELSRDRGEMPQSVAKKLLARVSDESPSVLLLSRSDELNGRPMDLILSLFAGEKFGLKTGERSGIQYLSRETPNDTLDSADPKDNPLLKRQTEFLKETGATK